MAAARDLLFGLVALQNGLIDQGQLVAAFQAWSRDQFRSLADLLLARGDLDAADHAAVEALVARHLLKHGGDAERSLAAIPAGRSTREKLAGVADPALAGTLAHLGSGATEPDADRTATYAVGTVTTDGRRFRVLRPHARGGLGAVFVALDEELHREVALKQILDHHADDPTSRARFLLEAEITGGLEHPGIVPVYGLGTYGDGRPYYAMRFVRGDSLQEAIGRFHADGTLTRDPGKRSLALRQLLRRFLDVCNAIDYAHTRGVLHRDIKPGNVIVGKHGETLVVDWGLAKPLGRVEPGPDSGERPLTPNSASGSAETLPGSALGTPSYMSPEQAAGDLDRLGPRSDVYSLGATLYCLLTGKPPFGGDDVGSVLRAVQKGEFPPPRKLDPSNDRALEAVCLRAMATSPEDRYPSCRALADDVERWMADEPVTAWREPLSRRARRWARRNRTAVTAAAALLLTAVVALSVSTVLISREKSRAEQSFRQARQAVDDYFTTVSESKLLNVPGLQPLRKDLLDRALKYYQGFIRERGGDRTVRAELAATYYRVAWITGIAGSRAEALDPYRQALARYEDLVRDHPAEARYQTDLAIVCNDLGNLYLMMGQTDRALETHRRALAIREAASRAHPDGARYQNELAKGYANVAGIESAAGKPDEALRLVERARALNEAVLAARPASLALPTDLGRSFNTLAAVQDDLVKDYSRIGQYNAQLGRPDEALRAYERGVTVAERLVAENPGVDDYRGTLVMMETQTGYAHQAGGRPVEAMQHFDRARALIEDLVARNPSVTSYRVQLASLEIQLGYLLRQRGRHEDAVSHMERARTLLEDNVAREPSVPGHRSQLAYLESQMGFLSKVAGRSEEAMRHYEKARALVEEIVAREPSVPDYRSQLAGCQTSIVSLLTDTGRHAEALAPLHKAVALQEALAAEKPTVAYYRKALATSQLYFARFPADVVPPAEALAALRRGEGLLAAAPDLIPVDHYNLACIRARAIPLVGRVPGEPPAERGRYEALAMETLRRAIARGYTDVSNMEADSDLDALRARDDFKSLIAELKARARMQAPPPSPGASTLSPAAPKAVSLRP
jgi:serine/threonine protein kinase/tetratricopeptide (TPR) repeat protein